MSLEERAQDNHQPADMIEPTQPQVDLAELYDELDSSPPARIVKNFKQTKVDPESSDDPITAREIKIKRELDYLEDRSENIPQPLVLERQNFETHFK